MPTNRKDGVPLEERTGHGQRPVWRLHYSVAEVFSEQGVGADEIAESDFDALDQGQTLGQFFGEEYDRLTCRETRIEEVRDG
ncbi:MAG: hypothetical protein RDU25_05895 [Patescibacteria group bacterium]|nr:hypothetical protein [Patescibacteria group bacterium]